MAALACQDRHRLRAPVASRSLDHQASWSRSDANMPGGATGAPMMAESFRAYGMNCLPGEKRLRDDGSGGLSVLRTVTFAMRAIREADGEGEVFVCLRVDGQGQA